MAQAAPQILEGALQHACALIAAGERPAPFSTRDGKLLRLVPADRRLPPEAVAEHLAAALRARPCLLAAAAGEAQQRKPSPPLGAGKRHRHLAALLRGWAYLGAGDAAQALLDARCALASAPAAGGARTVGAGAGKGGQAATQGTRHSDAAASNSGNKLPAPSSRDGGSGGAPHGSAAAAASSAAQGALQLAVSDAAAPAEPLRGVRACAWAPAHELASAAYAAREEWSNAALHAQIACELEPNEPSLEEQLRALLPRLPAVQAAALSGAGAAGLAGQLAREVEERLPEILRPRPKWHYYNTWMAQRIAEQHPALPQPVVSKLLAQDAGELDFRISHPEALADQVKELLEVFHSGGAAALQAHAPAPLEWERVRQLVGPGAVGLPIGYEPPPPGQMGQLGGGAAAPQIMQA